MATLFDAPWASRQEFMDRLGAGLGGDYKTYAAAKRSRGVAGDFTVGDLTPYQYAAQEFAGDNGVMEVQRTGYKSALLDQLFGQGGWEIVSGGQSDGYNTPAMMLRTRTMADPTSATRHPGSWNGTIDPATGRLTGLQWINDDLSRGLIGNSFDGLGSVLTSPIGGPLAVLAAPFAFSALGAGAVPSGALPPGVAREIAYGAIGEAPGFGVGQFAAGAAGGAAADIAAAVGQPELGLAPQTGLTAGEVAAAPITASQASYAASPVKMALDAAKPYASLVGPGISLLGALQAPQAPQDLGPARVPGVEAPPEARGLQAARSPIVDVLNRNRRANRNRTQLTGPGGVNLESVKVGRNTLLGL